MTEELVICDCENGPQLVPADGCCADQSLGRGTYWLEADEESGA